MDTFEASNGMTVQVDGHPFALVNANGVTTQTFSGRDAQALREIFQHERDEELGRWRWPENPDYVVYRFDFDQTYLYVLNEATADVFGLNGIDGYPHDEAVDDELAIFAAEAFLAAHPERKPWHTAEPGEVWVLSIDDSEDIPCIVTPSGPDFEPIAHPVWATLARGSDRITDARRIWPESD